MAEENIIIKTYPSWWRVFWWLFFAILIIPLLVALWKHYSVLVKITKNRVIVERGVLSKSHREIAIRDIRVVDVEQSFFQRILGYGNCKIASSGTDIFEDVIQGIPKPLQLKEAIMGRKEILAGRHEHHEDED